MTRFTSTTPSTTQGRKLHYDAVRLQHSAAVPALKAVAVPFSRRTSSLNCVKQSAGLTGCGGPQAAQAVVVNLLLAADAFQPDSVSSTRPGHCSYEPKLAGCCCCIRSTHFKLGHGKCHELVGNRDNNTNPCQTLVQTMHMGYNAHGSSLLGPTWPGLKLSC